MISEHLNLLRLLLSPRICSILVDVLFILKKNIFCCCYVNCFINQVKIIDSFFQVFSFFTDFLFILSTSEREVLKSPTIHLELTFCPFSSISFPFIISELRYQMYLRLLYFFMNFQFFIIKVQNFRLIHFNTSNCCCLLTYVISEAEFAIIHICFSVHHVTLFWLIFKIFLSPFV